MTRDNRRAAANHAFQMGVQTGDPAVALAALARAIILSPDLPRYRQAFGERLACIDASMGIRPALIRALRKHGVLQALCITLRCGGRAAAAAEPFASAVILSHVPLRLTLDRLGTAAAEQVSRALVARPLRQGGGAAVLDSALRGVLIQTPELWSLIHSAALNVAWAQLTNNAPVFRDANGFLSAVQEQMTFHYGAALSRKY